MGRCEYKIKTPIPNLLIIPNKCAILNADRIIDLCDTWSNVNISFEYLYILNLIEEANATQLNSYRSRKTEL